MKLRPIVTGILIAAAMAAVSQTVEQPAYGLKSHETLEITRIVTSPGKTVFYMSIENRIQGGTFCADKNIFIITPDGTRIKLKESVGIPACPGNYKFGRIGEKLDFSLVFPQTDPSVNWVDITEECSSNCFSFYGVVLNSELNVRIDGALSLAENGKTADALIEYKNILEGLTAKDQGIKGALYTDIITLLLEGGDNNGAREWYNRMLTSGAPQLEFYIKNLNSRGIKY